MKTRALITTLSITLTTAAQAHPGHPGHDDWPFEDVSWSLVALAGGVILLAIYAWKAKGQN